VGCPAGAVLLCALEAQAQACSCRMCTIGTGNCSRVSLWLPQYGCVGGAVLELCTGERRSPLQAADGKQPGSLAGLVSASMPHWCEQVQEILTKHSQETMC
jgi:hypothetical protein